MASIQINNEFCNTYGGVKKLYIAPFFNARRSDFIFDKHNLTTTKSLIFDEVLFLGRPTADSSATFEQSKVAYNQTVNFNFTQINKIENVDQLPTQRYRVLIQDNNDEYFIMGLRHGLRVKTLAKATGSSFGEFNQWQLSMSGQEFEPLAYINDLTNIVFESLGIDDMEIENNFIVQ